MCLGIVAWAEERAKAGTRGWHGREFDTMAAALKTTPITKNIGHKLPVWLRIAALVWFLAWFPAYWHVWGAANFLHLCDIAVIVGCIGFWIDSALLIASQAVACLVVNAAWTLDAAWALVWGHHLIGGTEYLFDPSRPLWVRLLSLFHVVMPVLMLWAVHRLGYDRRGYFVQLAIALPVFVASRLTPPTQNINYAFTDPFFHRALGPAPVHVAITFLFMAVVAYLPTHLALRRFFPPPEAANG
jgi:hypothetical protein